MTKNAQQALRYLIQQYSRDVRFCLICNYISRIERALQNEFVRLRFCQLPQKDIYNFLDTIQKTENLKIPKEQLKAVQFMFKSDIRSMINFIQSNHTSLSSGVDPGVITNEVWEKLISVIKTSKSEKEVEKYITCQSSVPSSRGNSVHKWICGLPHKIQTIFTSTPLDGQLQVYNPLRRNPGIIYCKLFIHKVTRFIQG